MIAATEGEMIEVVLMEAIEEAGSTKAFAKKHGFSVPFISDVKRGRRPMTKRLANALGFEQDVSYVNKDYILRLYEQEK